MIDRYLDNSINTEDEQIEVEEEQVQQEIVYEEESEEIVSNRFEMFKTEKRRRFSDIMDDEEYEEEVETDDNEFDYDSMVGLLNNKQEKPQEVRKERIPNKLNKIQDLKLRELLMMELEDAEFTLSQELATGQIDFNDYGYYMNKIEEYYNQPEVEDEEKEGLATIEEVVKVKNKAKEEQVNVVDEDPYDNFDYYDEMLNIMNEEKAQVVQQPEPEVEEVQENEQPMDDKMSQMMHNLLYMDDDDDDLYPEDFLINNLSDLGFDEEDDEDDIKAYDAVLENIRKGNNVDLDELEDMIDDEENLEVESEEEFIATLKIFDPNNKVEQVVQEPDVEEEVQEEHQQEEKVQEENKNDSIFKVRRNTSSTVLSVDNETTVEVKRRENKNETVLKVNDVEEESIMSKVFKQMQDVGIIHQEVEKEDDDE